LLRGRGIAHIELKSWNGTAEAVAAVLAKALAAGAMSDEFIVSSFHLPELARFHACLPAIPIAALVAGVPLDLASVAQRMDATALHLGNDFVDLPLVADAKARGLAVRVYTVNEPSTMLDLMRLGVDGLITDFPDRALALRRTASETALEPR
jgi:glycerophosphoryl diester phosphodiesterase